MDGDPRYYDTHYWHPRRHRRRARSRRPVPRRVRLPDGARAARRRPPPVHAPPGWTCPGTPCFGNHDGLVQGNFPPHAAERRRSPPARSRSSRRRRASRRPTCSTPDGQHLDAGPRRRSSSRRTSGRSRPTRTAAAQPRARSSRSTSPPRPPGRPRLHRRRTATDGTAYYTFDRGPVPVRRHGHRQPERRRRRVARPGAVRLAAGDASRRATGKAVRGLQPPHHRRRWPTRSSAPAATRAAGARRRGRGVPAAPAAASIAWVNGHTHRNQIWPHRARRRHRRLLGDQHRLPHRLAAAVAAHRDRGQPATARCRSSRTMLDHAGPAEPRAATSARPLQLAAPVAASCRANDPQERTCEPPAARRTTATSSCWSRKPAGDLAGLQPSRVRRRCAASWPQAPSISRPRVSRTVVGTPLASSRRTNSRSSRGSDAVHFEPGVGLSGIRLTCTQPQSPYDVQHVAEQVGAPGLVVDAAHHGVLDRDPALGRPGVVPGRLDGLGDRTSGC